MTDPALNVMTPSAAAFFEMPYDSSEQSEEKKSAW